MGRGGRDGQDSSVIEFPPIDIPLSVTALLPALRVQ